MHLQPRRKLREWCNRLTPARQLTSPPSEGVGRCVTLWCGLHVPHPPMLGCHARWWHAGDILAGCSCPRRESGVFQSPGARKGARPATKAGRGATWSSLPWERRRSVPGRELSGPGADDPTSRGLPQGPGRGHTEVPGALWALDAATSVVLPLRPVSGCGSRWV